MKSLVSSSKCSEFLANVLTSNQTLLVAKAGGIEGQILWRAVLSADANALKNMPNLLFKQIKFVSLDSVLCNSMLMVFKTIFIKPRL